MVVYPEIHSNLHSNVQSAKLDSLKKTVASLILAGGLSSRMGSDKASLVVDGVSLLKKNQDLLAQLNLETVLVSGAKAGQISDKIKQAGPVGGIFSALDFVKPESALLVLPVDMPNLNTQVLQQLIDYGMANQTSCYFDHYFLPAFFYDVSRLQQASNQLITQPGKACSIRALLNKVNARAIFIEAPSLEKCLINVNTPQQWQTYIKQQT
ncbi:molybdenum cofactor guanylyltransferase [Catenovulum adriaticum]|uniref:Molybdenum cofactor guanylyltransferase n=1 Tax=Catenovulum adriaticum TaxID=2984846 RepID=A0ABY7AJU4_9ALTE|nr:molybdenum cofactor guanylyltransferase [Catenovulum sp. TS8]WAJ69809.1 molybdenum cofactor guanylyltransferase [Catenovulum sp. TS8]